MRLKKVFFFFVFKKFASFEVTCLMSSLRFVGLYSYCASGRNLREFLVVVALGRSLGRFLAGVAHGRGLGRFLADVARSWSLGRFLASVASGRSLGRFIACVARGRSQGFLTSVGSCFLFGNYLQIDRQKHTIN